MRLKSAIRVVLVDTLNALLPEPCALCNGKACARLGLCARCVEVLPWLQACCLNCARSLPENGICTDCALRRRGFDAAVATLRYEQDARQLVRRLKYDQELALARVLGELMLKGPRPLLFPGSVLVAVPLTRRRLVERRFNQAMEIALVVGNGLGLPVCNVLRRQGEAVAQVAQRSAEQRQLNVRGQFATAGRLGRPAIVVDDVMTTGSTAEAVALALRAGGCPHVQVWAATRA